MSRAFVREVDETAEALPDRPVSGAPNIVTPEGLAFIDAEIERLRRDLAEADAAGQAAISRDLRYWTARRASAHVAPAPDDPSIVQFGATVDILREGKPERFRIVGEDEADPNRGTISHVSPLAQAMLGKGVGDVVTVVGAEVEIVRIGPNGRA